MLDVAKIKRIREKLKLSQEDAAKLAGMNSRQSWELIESGRRTNITLKTLAKIGEALGVDPRKLLGP